MSGSIFDAQSNYFEDLSLFVGVNNFDLIVDTKYTIPVGSTVSLIVKIPYEIVDPLVPNVVEWVGTIFNNTCIKYSIKTLDLPVSGIYVINASVKTLTEANFIGETALLKVKAIGE